jgi:putative addiction module killer protein
MAYTVLTTYEFVAFIAELRDDFARTTIYARIERVKMGLLGNIRTVQGGVSEVKVDVGPGYRVYFTVRNREVIILLCAGDKRTQEQDIRKAQKMAEDY